MDNIRWRHFQRLPEGPGTQVRSQSCKWPSKEKFDNAQDATINHAVLLVGYGQDKQPDV